MDRNLRELAGWWRYKVPVKGLVQFAEICLQDVYNEKDPRVRQGILATLSRLSCRGGELPDRLRGRILTALVRHASASELEKTRGVKSA